MVYGYARVSSKEQHLDRQIAALLDAGVELKNIQSDMQSGRDFNRKSYNLLVGTDYSSSLLREGDLLIICSIDRLGRNYSEITKEWKKITSEIKADIRVLDMPLLDTRNGECNLDNRFIANLVLEILSYVAEKERLQIKKTQADGIRLAKEKGVHMGRPKAKFPDHWEAVYNKWKSGDIMTVQAIQELNLRKSTFYNLVKRYEGTN